MAKHYRRCHKHAYKAGLAQRFLDPYQSGAVYGPPGGHYGYRTHHIMPATAPQTLGIIHPQPGYSAPRVAPQYQPSRAVEHPIELPSPTSTILELHADTRPRREDLPPRYSFDGKLPPHMQQPPYRATQPRDFATGAGVMTEKALGVEPPPATYGS